MCWSFCHMIHWFSNFVLSFLGIILLRRWSTSCVMHSRHQQQRTTSETCELYYIICLLLWSYFIKQPGSTYKHPWNFSIMARIMCSFTNFFTTQCCKWKSHQSYMPIFGNTYVLYVSTPVSILRHMWKFCLSMCSVLDVKFLRVADLMFCSSVTGQYVTTIVVVPIWKMLQWGKAWWYLIQWRTLL